jgi:hypothetical protein
VPDMKQEAEDGFGDHVVRLLNEFRHHDDSVTPLHHNECCLIATCRTHRNLKYFYGRTHQV